MAKIVTVDPSQRQPKYQRIREHLYAEINAGRYAPGQALPTEAQLAEMLGISRNTIRQALGELEGDGIVKRVQGRGTFVTNEQERKALQQLDAFALIAPQLREGFYPSLVEGFEQSSADIQCQVLVASSANDVSRQGDLILQMIDKRVAGVALVPVAISATPLHQIRQLHEHSIPVVFCHRTVDGVTAPSVGWDGEEVGRTAGAALLAREHRCVGALFGYEDGMVRQFLQGLRIGLEDESCLPSRLVRFYGRTLPGPDALDLVRGILREMLDGDERPTAIFCGNQVDAEQVYFSAMELGLQVPRDLSIVHFGGTWRNGPLAQRLSCVAVDEHMVGVRAGVLLSEMRSGKRPLDSDERIQLRVTLLPGETLGTAAKQT
jgi:DNA-binding LacI/PurR family transcriptional regulator